MLAQRSAPQAGLPPLGRWLVSVGLADHEPALRSAGASTVEDLLAARGPYLQDKQLAQLGLGLIDRAKLCNALAALEGSPNAAGEVGRRHPIATAELSVESAREQLALAQHRLQVAETELHKARRLRILIVGFGNFGQFLGAKFADGGHTVIGTSRSDYTAVARDLGCSYASSVEQALSDYDPQVIILCTSILSTTTVVKKLPLQALAGRLVVDVLSVKEFPKQLLLKLLPRGAGLLCTHPMFGPDSARVNGGWQGLPFMYERVNREPAVGDGCLDEITTAFLSIWADAGCRMIEMTCEEHDSYAASSQFMAHTTGRLLAELEPQTTPIDTRGYKALLDLVQTTTNDSFELYCGLFYYNANSKEQLDKLERGLRHLRSRLAEFESEQLAKDGGMAMRWMRDTSLSSTPVEKTTPQKWSSSQGLTKGEASLQTTTIHQSISPLARPPTEHVGFLSPATSLLERELEQARAELAALQSGGVVGAK